MSSSLPAKSVVDVKQTHTKHEEELFVSTHSIGGIKINHYQFSSEQYMRYFVMNII